MLVIKMIESVYTGYIAYLVMLSPPTCGPDPAFHPLTQCSLPISVEPKTYGSIQPVINGGTMSLGRSAYVGSHGGLVRTSGT